MIDFASPVEAVKAAIKIQKEIFDLNNNPDKQKQLEFRVGINTGDVIIEGDNLFGDGVNVAARLEAAGDAGGILMSYETYAHVQDMVEVEEKESVKMKGINREIKVFSVLKRRTSKQRKKIVSSKDKTNKASYDHKIKEIKNDLFSLQKK